MVFFPAAVGCASEGSVNRLGEVVHLTHCPGCGAIRDGQRLHCFYCDREPTDAEVRAACERHRHLSIRRWRTRALGVLAGLTLVLLVLSLLHMSAMALVFTPVGPARPKPAPPPTPALVPQKELAA